MVAANLCLQIGSQEQDWLKRPLQFVLGMSYNKPMVMTWRKPWW